MYHEPSFEPTRDEMMEILKKHIPFLDRKEMVSLSESDGRIAADDIFAPYSLPNQDASGCDGIAVSFSVFERGMPDTSSWMEGKEYVYSNTGVAIPEEYDTVIPIEGVTVSENGSIILASVPECKGSEVTPAGSQIRRDELLVKKGETIHPGIIGILGSAGFTYIPVFAKPKVIFIPTGDELVPSGFPVPKGKNVESNSLMVSAFLRRFGAEAVSSPIIPDDLTALRKALSQAVASADMVIIGAGSSKGTKDYTMDVLEELGEVIVQELGVAPGKHCSLTMVGNVPVLGIPGPPGGAQLISQYYVKAAVELLTAGSVRPVPTVSAILEADLSPKWIDFMQPVRLYEKGGVLYAQPLRPFGYTRAEGRDNSRCIFYCKGKTGYEKGTRIDVEMCF